MARNRKDLGHVANTGITAALTRGETAAETAARLRASGVNVSARTVSRRMREQRGHALVSRASSVPVTSAPRATRKPVQAPPGRRTAEVVLAGLPEADRELVLDWTETLARECLQEEQAAMVARLEELGREQASMPACAVCGLRGLPPKAVT